MIFQNVLVEYAYEIPLRIWNAKQKALWHDLVKTGTIRSKDIKKFRQFAKVFDELYIKKHRFPSMKEIIRAMGENK